MNTSPSAGLCNSCAHQRPVPTARTMYSLCGLAADDRRFPRYPPLPVSRCSGFAPRNAGDGEAVREPSR